MRFAIVIEKAEGNYSAYVPDLPGCVASGDSVEAQVCRDADRWVLPSSEDQPCPHVAVPPH